MTAGDGVDDILYGGDGNDLLIGSNVSSDQLFGGAGDDELRSRPLNAPPTQLSGGSGDDILVGNRYADTYHFDIGDGQDIIDETAGGLGSFQDKILFAPGITPQDVTVAREELDLILSVGSDGDRIRILEWYRYPGANGYDRRLEAVVFENTVWQTDTIEGMAVENFAPILNIPLVDQSATAFVPFELKIESNIFIDVDQLAPLTLSATLSGAQPLPAWLSFDTSSSHFFGTPSVTDAQSLQVVLTATDQHNSSVFDNFELNVSLPSGALISGTAGDDLLTATPLDDVFILGRGNDTLSGGDGNDTFVALGTKLDLNHIDGGNGFDRIVGGLEDDVIRLGSFGPGHGVELVDGGSGFDILKGTGASEIMDFSQTTLLNIEKIDAGGGKDTVIRSQGADVIVGGGDDVLFGAEGDDRFLIQGSQGVDLFNGGAGNDSIIADVTNNKIRLQDFSNANTVELIDTGEGFDMLVGTSRSQTLDFSATTLIGVEQIHGKGGRDVIVGSSTHDVIFGGGGNDTLHGGPGDDALHGGRGDDQFVFAAGDGEDVVSDKAGRHDRLILSGMNHDRLWLWRQNDDLALGLLDTADRVVVKDWFAASIPPIEVTRTSDDSMQLINGQVLQLVDAMSVFDPTTQGHLNVPPSLLEDLTPAITEAWQPV